MDQQQFIFELVDASNEEAYYTIGVFLSLEDAIKGVASESEPWTLAQEGAEWGDSAKLEIRKREVGKLAWSETGEVVWSKTWVCQYDDEEPTWMANPCNFKDASSKEEA